MTPPGYSVRAGAAVGLVAFPVTGSTRACSRRCWTATGSRLRRRLFRGLPGGLRRQASTQRDNESENRCPTDVAAIDGHKLPPEKLHVTW